MGVRRNWILSTLYSIYSVHHGPLRVVKTKKATLIGRGQVSLSSGKGEKDQRPDVVLTRKVWVSEIRVEVKDFLDSGNVISKCLAFSLVVNGKLDQVCWFIYWSPLEVMPIETRTYSL